MSAHDLAILRYTVLDARTLSCPICIQPDREPFVVDVPPIQRVPDTFADIFGMSGDTLSRVFVDQEVTKAVETMRTHLHQHSPEEWLEWAANR